MTVAQVIGRSASCGARLGDCFRTDARLLVRAILWRISLPLVKQVIPVRTLVRWMSPRIQSTGEIDSVRGARLQAIRYFLAHGGRVVMSENCLVRSLVLFRFLAEVGAAPALVMGVSREGGRVDGHAWIEVDGEPLADATTGRYTPVLIFGDGGSVLH